MPTTARSLSGSPTADLKLQRTANTGLSVGTLTCDTVTPRRNKVYELTFGSEAAPADNPYLWVVQRCTAFGTATALTPQPLDPADAAGLNDVNENQTVDATYTANQFLLEVPLNQRATFRWVAAPGSEMVTPATASNGVGIKTPTATALVITATIMYEEQ